MLFFFASRRRHTRCLSDWSSDVCSSDLLKPEPSAGFEEFRRSDSKLALGVAPLLAGFFLDSEALCFITESELYAGTARSRAARDRKSVSSVEGMLRDLSELRSGDPVVHVQHC